MASLTASSAERGDYQMLKVPIKASDLIALRSGLNFLVQSAASDINFSGLLTWASL